MSGRAARFGAACLVGAALLGAAMKGAAAGSADDAKLLAPPPGIVATSATVAAVLRLHEKAIGTPTASGATRREAWARNEIGLAGTETLVRDGLDYHARLQRGPFLDEYWQVVGKRWHRSPNGVVSAMQSEDYDSFTMLRVLEDGADPKNDVKLLGEVADPKPAYVLEVRRSGYKHPEWIFFEKATGLVSRVEAVEGTIRVVSVYDDYRTANGLLEPWHVHDVFGDTGAELDYARKSQTFGELVDPHEFDVPAGGFDPARFDEPAILPSKIPYGSVIVRLMVDGRGLDFEVAAGESKSYLNRDVALELHLPTFDQLTRAKNGKNVGFDTQIPEATIGQTTLRNFAVRAVSFSYHPTQDTKVVGVLGYDFLCSGVFKIDYVKGQFEFADLAKEVPKMKNAFVLPVNFDDGLPFIKGSIASHESEDILFDNSFTFSMLFGAFTNRFPEAAPDTRGKKHKSVVPFADSSNYGREADVWLSKLSEMNFGTQKYLNLEMFATDGDAGRDHPVDAVIGFDFLVLFDVYLDFSHERVILNPNENFARRFRRVAPS